MKKSSSQSTRKNGEEKEGNLMGKKPINHDNIDVDDQLAHTLHCITLFSNKPRYSTQTEYGPWRQDHKSKLAVLERHIQARRALEDTIDEQLKHFNTHYNKAMVPTQLKDVAQILVPKWAPPLEMACTGWLGDWRPSAILKLVQSLARSSYLSSSSAESVETDGVLSQLIHEIRIEEMVIDEEMAEIQATCILHLPFGGPVNQVNGSRLDMVQSELKKVKQVIVKAQQLRYKALELVVKRVLSQIDAAEFLVAFAGIQDLVHRFAARQKNKKNSVSIRDLRSV